MASKTRPSQRSISPFGATSAPAPSTIRHTHAASSEAGAGAEPTTSRCPTKGRACQGPSARRSGVGRVTGKPIFLKSCRAGPLSPIFNSRSLIAWLPFAQARAKLPVKDNDSPAAPTNTRSPSTYKESRAGSVIGRTKRTSKTRKRRGANARSSPA